MIRNDILCMNFVSLYIVFLYGDKSMVEAKKPLRVAQIIGKFDTGGVKSYIMNYYKNIDRSKIQFDFIIDSDSETTSSEEIEKMGGRIMIVPPYKNIFQYLKTLTKVFRENQYQIVHSNINALSVFPLFAAWKAKVPIRIAHSHSTGNKNEKMRNVLKNILRPFSKIFATHYFACSEHAGKWLFGTNALKNNKICIINNAIDIDKFKYNIDVRNSIRKELNVENKFVLGNVGRFMTQKNHNFLINLFDYIHTKDKSAVLLLLGDGPLKSEIEKKVELLHLENNVYFLGNKENISDYLSAMDVFVFPSLYEGLGMVVIESQAADLFCVCSQNVPEEVKMTDKVAFVSLEDSYEKWYKTICECRNLNRKNSVSMDDYDIKREAKKLETIYLDLFDKIKID